MSGLLYVKVRYNSSVWVSISKYLLSTSLKLLGYHLPFSNLSTTLSTFQRAGVILVRSYLLICSLITLSLILPFICKSNLLFFSNLIKSPSSTLSPSLNGISLLVIPWLRETPFTKPDGVM